MRPLVIFLTLFPLFVVAAPGAAAPIAGKTDGATFLQLQDGHGFAGTRLRGNYFGRVDHGRIVASKNVLESGCDHRRRLGNGLRLCRGHDITFHTPSSERWRVRLRGDGVSATGWVRGCLRLDARNSGSTGTFRRGSFFSDPRPWPRTLTSYRLGNGSC
jgi:hypothetical protein